MDALDSAVLDIVRARSRWNRETHLKIREVQGLCGTRFGVHPRGRDVLNSIKRLQRTGLIRWAKTKKTGDIYLLV